MISMSEILKGARLENQTPEIQKNLNDLLAKINVIRTAYGKSMTVSSGLRTMEDHLRIYREKGITDTKKIPMKSNHLMGNALDIADPKQELQKWCLANIALLESTGLYMEDFSATKTWVHFQRVSPKSGKRFFMP